MNWFFKRFKRSSPKNEIQFHVADLHCQMCAQTVREALRKVEGVKQVRINLARKNVAIAAAPEIEVDSLIEALKPTGYRAEAIDPARANKFS
ncbi:heavy-metal-associated domain-containing protein [Myxosarcina sp. GI1(2024)]